MSVSSRTVLLTVLIFLIYIVRQRRRHAGLVRAVDVLLSAHGRGLRRIRQSDLFDQLSGGEVGTCLWFQRG